VIKFGKVTASAKAVLVHVLLASGDMLQN